MIRDMAPADWPAVRAIYEEGIATGHATFQTGAPSWDEWDAGHLARCRFVFVRDEGDIAGWAALSPVSKRPVYAGVTEVSVYVAARARGAGAGRTLLTRLIDESERCGIWTLQAGIFPENHASLALHQRCGFRIVGRREKLGAMGGWWRDVLLLERRSGIAGVGESLAPDERTLLHITTAGEAHAAAEAGSYTPQAFAVEGFIHCSYPRQVRAVANRRFAGQSDLVLFEIDRARVPHTIVDENLEGGQELFPHVYGRLPMDAVVRVHPFPCNADGQFELPAALAGGAMLKMDLQG
jgi:phosphinothricin acetyltransferase